jgi:hypothetical protein
MSYGNSNFNSIDDSLIHWQQIEHQFKGGGILIGNGFSQAVWGKFGYSSLFETASSDECIQYPLSHEDRRCFDVMNTKIFEIVLSNLANADKLNSALGCGSSVVMERYRHIRNALGEAVRAVHVPWNIVPDDVLVKIREELRSYKFVYSTNYDLLIYWSVMHENNGRNFVDFFWNKSTDKNSRLFSITNTDVWDNNKTRILYLHGALHLHRDERTGRTHKLVNREGNLLDIPRVPLFVSEGSSEDKLRAISSSDYLSFAYNQFKNHQAPLVIFGHSLSEMDEHLLEAIRNMARNHKPKKWIHGEPLKIAISVYRGKKSPEELVEQKANLQKKLCEELRDDQKPELTFFNSKTHPLGSTDIKIESENTFFSILNAS